MGNESESVRNLIANVKKDVLEAKRRDTLASKTRFYGDAMKLMLMALDKYVYDMI